jgi:polysaccharide biosynthesis protein PslH
MKILMVTPMPPSPRAAGAIPVVLHAGLVGLAARHDVTVVTVAGPREAELEAVEELGTRGVEVHAARRLAPRGLERWHRRGRLTARWLASGWPRRTVWFYEPEVERTVRRLLETRGFDVVAVEDNSMGVYRYPPTVPRVLTEHEVRRPRPLDWGRATRGGGAGMLAELDWRRWRSYQAAIWNRFELVQVFTQRDADAVLEVAPHLEGRVRTNPYGVELPAEPDPGLEAAKRIVFVGNFRHRPNVDAALWLVEAILPRVREHVPDVQTTLVGLDPPREVRALAGDGVDVPGAVPDVGPLLARSAVVLAPIRVGGGMRMKVLHAMAHGKAVVTTRRGAEGLALAGERPPLLVAEDAAGLSEATVLLLGDNERRRALGRMARAFVAAHFSPTAYARRLESVYEDLVGPGDAADAA